MFCALKMMSEPGLPWVPRMLKSASTKTLKKMDPTTRVPTLAIMIPTATTSTHTSDPTVISEVRMRIVAHAVGLREAVDAVMDEVEVSLSVAEVVVVVGPVMVPQTLTTGRWMITTRVIMVEMRTKVETMAVDTWTTKRPLLAF